MRRTRKWGFVAQEAARLAALGLSPLDISKRLEVNKSTVTRWMATGKLKRTRGQAAIPPTVDAPIGRTPSEWSKSVRAEYSLDHTDDQLVTLAETALELSLNNTVAPHVRMNAAGRFQALVRQLALVARGGESEEHPPSSSAPPPVQAVSSTPALRKSSPRPPRRGGADPRQHLMALVKK